MKKIDFEAHFYTKAYLKALANNKTTPKLVEKDDKGVGRLWYTEDLGQPFAPFLVNKLVDLGEGRLKEMDEYGIDVQLLSLSAPGLEQLDPAAGAALAVESNDALAEVTRKYPDRFMGYIALAPKAVDASLKEMERAVKELGFKGWNTHSNYGDTCLDDERFLPLLAKAEELNIPIYIHPTIPQIPQVRVHGFALGGPGMGFGIDTTITIMRLIFSGVFDKFPRLQVILGHLGEALPFLLKRMDWAYLRPIDPSERPNLKKKPSEYFKTNIYVTTSGNYYEPAFMCTYEALGVGRILLGTDHPYEDIPECMEFLAGLPISEEDKNRIYGLNGQALIG